MNVLAIDSSSDILAVAFHGESLWAEASIDLGLRHAEQVMNLVDFCMSMAGLAPSDLDLIACARGPGSFTGLRIGMATTKGIALGTGKAWVSVPTLDCLAWGLEHYHGIVAPILDGRKGRVYSALYLRGERIGDWLDVPLAQLAALLDTYPEALVTGPDAELFRDFAAERSGFSIDRRSRTSAARALAVLAEEAFVRGGAGDPEVGPLYLRPSEAEETFAAWPRSIRENRG
jgi:tRNA threonylcarbamoyladenosine biosynthesis protein TsaB